MIVLGSTRAVLNKLLRDVKNTVFWVSFSVQILFLTYYGWSIYSNIDRLPFLIVYSCLAAVAVAAFINFLIVHKRKDLKNKKFDRFLRVSKYVINGVMLAVNAYQFVCDTCSDLQLILFALSAIFWLVNIVVEIVRVVIEKYVELFSVAIKEDFAFFYKMSDKIKELTEKVDKAKEVKGNFWEAVNAPFEAIANKLDGKKKEPAPVQEEAAPTSAEKMVDELTDDLKDELEEKKQQKKEEKQRKKEEIKNSSNARAEAAKQGIKENVKKIWEHIKPKKKDK